MSVRVRVNCELWIPHFPLVFLNSITRFNTQRLFNLNFAMHGTLHPVDDRKPAEKKNASGNYLIMCD